MNILSPDMAALCKQMQTVTPVSIQMQTKVAAPATIRSSFKASYTQKVASVSTSQSELTVKKAAAIQTIKESAYRTAEPTVITKAVQQIAAADATTFKTVVNQSMATIQLAHAETFSKGVSTIVKQASTRVGLSNVTMRHKVGTTIIVAKNEVGQAVVTEVRMDQRNGNLSVVSETIGFRGKACDELLNKLDQALVSAGLSFSKDERGAGVRWTYGESYLPTSAEVEKQIKEEQRVRENGVATPKEEQGTRDRERTARMRHQTINRSKN